VKFLIRRSSNQESDMKITLAILTGGKSKRMGQDKAFLSFLGETLVERIMRRLDGLAQEVLFIGPNCLNTNLSGIRSIPDLLPGRGPLGGLYTALNAASQPAVALIACDMPFVSADLLAYQNQLLESENMDIVLASTARGLEPLHAIYRRKTCLPATRDALNNGENRLISWFPKVKVRILTYSEIIPFDNHGLTFLNVNTPDELIRAEKMAISDDPEI
jgi:molybdopterin-guanine dinucleotide biosynthesis protein A